LALDSAIVMQNSHGQAGNGFSSGQRILITPPLV